MTTNRTSRFPGFYKITVRERRELVSEATGASIEEMATALETGGLDPETADKFVENVLGTYALPFGIAPNVRVNGKDFIVPMVVEEPSVIAAASNAAKMVRAGGGFVATGRSARVCGFNSSSSWRAARSTESQSPPRGWLAR